MRCDYGPAVKAMQTGLSFYTDLPEHTLDPGKMLLAEGGWRPQA